MPGTISKLLILFHAQQTRTLVDVFYKWCPLKSSPFIQYSINVASLMTRKEHCELSVRITLYHLGRDCIALHCIVLCCISYSMKFVTKRAAQSFIKEVSVEEV